MTARWFNPRRPAVRAMVLGAAVVVALIVAAGADDGTIARAQAKEPTIVIVQAETRTSPSKAATTTASPDKPATGTTGGKPAATKPPAPDSAPATESDKKIDEDADADVDIQLSPHGIDVHPRGVGVLKDGKRVRIQGLGRDREYDSFEQFAHDAPWVAGLVFMVVSLVFLVPLLIVVLLIWYKVRKTRMMNETMIKLAERGVAPTPEMVDALAAGKPAMSAPTSATAPLFEQARQLRKRAAWSDLRKGVVMLAIGLGLSFWSILDDGTPNSVGLVLLFVGIGYCVLWYFEERTVPPSSGTTGSPPSPGT